MNGYVLAGGRGLRMGVDKARIPYPGRWPMAVWVAGTMSSICDRVTLVRRVPDSLPWLGPGGRPLPVLVDAAGDDPHPLHGVAAALAHADSDRVAVAPCDVPALPAEAWRRLAAVGGAAVATDGHRVHPLVGIYPRGWAERAATAAVAGRSARSFADGATPVLLDPAWLVNVNRWEDTGRPGPIRALLAGLPWLDPAARAVVAEGERARLAARGVLDPDDPEGLP